MVSAHALSLMSITHSAQAGAIGRSCVCPHLQEAQSTCVADGPTVPLVAVQAGSSCSGSTHGTPGLLAQGPACGRHLLLLLAAVF
jgi:hypothetical protein